jgi:hypothetical protein
MSSSMGKGNIELQERDFELLHALFESRVLTCAHIAALFFHDRREATKKRLQKLKGAGYLGERPRRPWEPSILLLTREGHQLLRERGQLGTVHADTPARLAERGGVSQLTLQHELAVLDVKVSVVRALEQRSHVRLLEFSTRPSLHEFSVSTPSGLDVTVKPDGFLRLLDKRPGPSPDQAFFLEVDRSTESLDILVARATSYARFSRSGGFAVRNGGGAGDHRKHPFRVLFVFRTAQRRDNVAERLLATDPPILTQAWLTTLAEVKADPLGAIWVRPKDYATARRCNDRSIRRQASVARPLQKQELLSNEDPRTSPASPGIPHLGPQAI